MLAPVSDLEILRTLRNANPWWTIGVIPQRLVGNGRRAAFHQVQPLLARTGFLQRPVMLTGPNRSGKTTLLHQIAQEALAKGERSATEILYLPFAHPHLRTPMPGRILEIFRRHVSPGRARILLLLDEIYLASSWQTWIDSMADSHPDCQIVATGSASTALALDTATGGARWVAIQVPRFSWRERLKMILGGEYQVGRRGRHR